MSMEPCSTTAGSSPTARSPPSQQARANGHLVFLCTGRSLSELWGEIMDIGFDGVIAAAGGYVEVDGQVLHHQNVPVDQVARVMDFFDARGINYFLEANSGLYGSATIKAQMREVLYGGVTDENVLAELERGFAPFIDHLIVGADMLRDDINKISFLGSDVPFDDDPGRVRRRVRRHPGHRPAVRAQQRGAGDRRGSQGRRHRDPPGAPRHPGRGHDGLRRRPQRPGDAGVRQHRRGHGQRPPEGQGRRRRHHRQPRRGRPARPASPSTV